MRIAPDLYLVASGFAGLSFSDALDCNTWLIDTGDGLALFDSGAGRDVGGLVEQMRGDGLDASLLRHVFLTHAHADHSGGAAELRERASSGLTVHAGREAASRLESDDETRISLDRARRVGIYPADYRWRGVAVDDVMGDDAVVRVGRASIRLLETPGHSADHCSFLVDIRDRVILISGDAVFAGGKVVLQDIPDCSVSATLESLRRLGDIAFETFLPGHGAFAVRNGHLHAQRGRDYANTGMAPPSFF